MNLTLQSSIPKFMMMVAQKLVLVVNLESDSNGDDSNEF